MSRRFPPVVQVHNVLDGASRKLRSTHASLRPPGGTRTRGGRSANPHVPKKKKKWAVAAYRGLKLAKRLAMALVQLPKLGNVYRGPLGLVLCAHTRTNKQTTTIAVMLRASLRNRAPARGWGRRLGWPTVPATAASTVSGRRRSASSTSYRDVCSSCKAVSKAWSQ